jgi:ADP-ribosylglycohydrolase
MRVSPIGWLFTTLDETIKEAEKSAACTHNHPEGIKGAVAVAIAIFHASNGKDKTFIANEITQKVGYNLNFTLEQIKPTYRFDSSCQGSVPQAIKCFLESTNYEDAVRKAVSLGGDSDTLAAMTGSIAEAHYGGVPDNLKDLVMGYMANNMKQVLKKFEEQKEIVRQQREEYKLKH